MASIKCAHCKGTHGSVAEVRACAATPGTVITAPATASTQGHGGKPCNCPRSYSRCRYAVAADYAAGDLSKGHGGWGWPTTPPAAPTQEALAFLTQSPVAAPAMSVVSASPAFHQGLGHQRSARPTAAATDAQLRFIRVLDAERDAPVAGKTDEEAFIIARLEDVLGGGKFVSSGEASAVITWLKTLPLRGASTPTSSPAQPASTEPLPDVPEGHYAVASRTGNNDLDFFRVDRPTEGRWAGRTFVKRVIGGKPDHPVRNGERALALQAIVDAGIEAAAVLYGQEIGRCYRCNRHLTDETSRALGIGPDCRSK